MADRADDGLPAQKKSIHAAERDTEANRRRREAFVAELRTLAPERLIYLDESGVSTQMTRLYGRARHGRRGTAAVPGGHWKMVTILGALNHTGMLAAMTTPARGYPSIQSSLGPGMGVQTQVALPDLVIDANFKNNLK